MADTHSGNLNTGSAAGGPVWPGGASKQGPHRVGAFALCPQLEGFSQDMYLRPITTKDATAIGTLVHVGMAYRYAALLKELPGWFVYRDGREAIWNCGADQPHLREVALHIFDAYQAHWGAVLWRPLLVEHQFEVTLEGEPYTARLDLLAEESAEVIIVDHKCLPGDRVVYSGQGHRRVDELLGGNDWTCAAYKDDKLVWRPAFSPVPAGTQDVYQIRLKSGRIARYGWRHPVLTRRGFVKAKDLKAGDEVAVAINLPARQDSPVPDALLAVAGMLTGDGGLVCGDTIHYTKTSKRFRGYFKASLRELGMREGVVGGPRAFREAPRRSLVWFSKNAVAFQALHALGMERVGSAEKRIPRSLLGLSPRQVGILVGALWSSDGAMYVVKETRSSGTSKKVRIVYGSRSLGLCHDVQELLTQLGLVTTVTSSSVLYRGARRPYHFTTVVGRESKEKFLAMVERGEIRRPGGGPIAAKLTALLGRTKVRGKNPRVENDVYWDKIDSALYAGMEPCYDITVPDGETFVADGIVTHNSKGYIKRETGYEYRADRQMLTQLALARIHGYDVRRVVINAMTRPRPNSLGYYDLQNFKPKFARFDIPISAVAYNRLWEDTAYVLRQMKIVRQMYPDPSNRPRNWDACVRAYGVCEFAPLCIDGPDQLVQFTRRT